MTFMTTIHIIQYGIDMRGIGDELRESLGGAKAQETYRATPDVPFGAGASMMERLDHYLSDDHLETQRGLYNNAVGRFESALLYMNREKRIRAERGFVFLPPQYLNDPLYRPYDDYLWAKFSHAAILCLRRLRDGYTADWQTEDYSLAHKGADVVRFHKVSAWVNGRAQDLTGTNATHLLSGPAPFHLESYADVRFADRAVDPACHPALRNSTYMGYFAPPPSTPAPR